MDHTFYALLIKTMVTYHITYYSMIKPSFRCLNDEEWSERKSKLPSDKSLAAMNTINEKGSGPKRAIINDDTPTDPLTLHSRDP